MRCVLAHYLNSKNNMFLQTANTFAAAAVEVRREASQLTGLDLPVTLIFDYPSVAEIAAFIVGKLPAPVTEQPPTVPPASVAAGSSGVSKARSGSRRRRRALAAMPAEPAALSAEEQLAIVSSKVRHSALSSG